jgi:hypothetical protein
MELVEKLHYFLTYSYEAPRFVDAADLPTLRHTSNVLWSTRQLAERYQRPPSALVCLVAYFVWLKFHLEIDVREPQRLMRLVGVRLTRPLADMELSLMAGVDYHV